MAKIRTLIFNDIRRYAYGVGSPILNLIVAGYFYKVFSKADIAVISEVSTLTPTKITNDNNNITDVLTITINSPKVDLLDITDNITFGFIKINNDTVGSTDSGEIYVSDYTVNSQDYFAEDYLADPDSYMDGAYFAEVYVATEYRVF